MTYHFGTGQSSGAQQPEFFLVVSRPGPKTPLALDLEANENNPSNSMRLEQAKDFVQAVAEAAGRLPVVYVHPTWANGDPLPVSGLSLGARITPESILARCGVAECGVDASGLGHYPHPHSRQVRLSWDD